jgi:hypothetical protein
VDDKLKITINIGERIYPIGIQRNDTEREELIRKAAGLINDSLISFKQKAYKNKDDQDYLAMTALKYAVLALENDGKEDITPLIDDLKKINYSLEEAINQK